MILSALSKNAPDNVALISKNKTLTYQELIHAIKLFASWLKDHQITSLALLSDNSWEWVVVDLACQYQDIIFTPIPDYFSIEQQEKVFADAKPHILLSDKVLPYRQWYQDHNLNFFTYTLNADVSDKPTVNIPFSTSKITYTSGSTGSPKGVCLSIENQCKVAQSLIEVVGLVKPRHLCLLPFATLLENVAGVYAPLMSGGSIYIASNQERGFEGSQLISPCALLTAITLSQPNTLILVPELLLILINAVKSNWPVPPSIIFIAVGGSKVSPELIQTARQLKLPVYQGYGLSECASVVSIDSPLKLHKQHVRGSCGSVLPHLEVDVVDKELVIRGNTFLGYLEDPQTWYQTCVHSGDIAQIEKGELLLSGRRKNLIINSLGRNISPEWVESKLLATGLFSQAILIGDAKPYCVAILALFNPQTSREEIARELHKINNSLPDYAQIKGHHLLNQAMTFEQGLITANGRPKRPEILTYFTPEINELYFSERPVHLENN